jgi:hypothetical protein
MRFAALIGLSYLARLEFDWKENADVLGVHGNARVSNGGARPELRERE